MPNFDELKYKLPVAPLEVIAMDSAKDLCAGIDRYLVATRKAEAGRYAEDPSFHGYVRDSYLGKGRCPRFGTGEAKAVLDESIRGKDLFIVTDVTNHSITYRMNNYVNHMSPDDHYQDLKRMIAAAAGKAKRINIIMPFLYEGRQHKRSSRVPACI